jgi:hypothetical protein
VLYRMMYLGAVCKYRVGVHRRLAQQGGQAANTSVLDVGRTYIGTHSIQCWARFVLACLDGLHVLGPAIQWMSVGIQPADDAGNLWSAGV